MTTIVPGRVQSENDRVKVTRWTMRPGEGTGPHTHSHDYVVVPLADGVMSISEEPQQWHPSTLRRGESYTRNAGVHHAVENRGTAVVDFVEIELL